jgi:hypothetical protein
MMKNFNAILMFPIYNNYDEGKNVFKYKHERK